jgi:hypothetical protein
MQKESIKKAKDEVQRAKQERQQYFDQLELLKSQAELPGFLYTFLLKIGSLFDMSISDLEDNIKDMEAFDFENSTTSTEAGSAESEDPFSSEDINFGLFSISYTISTYLTSFLVLGIGSLVTGVDTGKYLILPPIDYTTTTSNEWLLSSGLTWAAWTLPYLGATLALGAIAPSLLTNKSLLRTIDPSSRLLSDSTALSLLFVSLTAAFTQTLAYQGLWYQSFLPTQRDQIRDLLEESSPMMSDTVGGFLGLHSSGGGLQLSSLLAIPTAILLTGLLEGGWFYFATLLRDADFEIKLNDFEISKSSSGGITNMIRSDSSSDNSNSGDRKKDVVEEQWDRQIQEVFFQPTRMSGEELLLSAVRVGVVGAYLAAETAVTHNLYMAMGTSAVGVLSGLLLLKQRGSDNDNDRRGGK